jgi:hypothetical protein
MAGRNLLTRYQLTPIRLDSAAQWEEHYVHVAMSGNSSAKEVLMTPPPKRQAA